MTRGARMSRLFHHDLFRQIIDEACRGNVADHPAAIGRAMHELLKPPSAPPPSHPTGIVIGTVNIYIDRPRPNTAPSN